MKTEVLIGMGSNLGNSRKTLLTAWKRIGESKEIDCIRLSSAYHSSPVGMESANWFVNCVGLFETSFSPRQLLTLLLELEIDLGRTRDKNLCGYQDRMIDLDIILFGDKVINETELVLPHPRFHKRLFVLEPLVEIAPETYHPLMKMSCFELREVLYKEFEEDDFETQKLKKINWK